MFLATILKIAAKMATIMATMATIFKSHLSLSHSSGRKSSKKQFSLKLQHVEILMCFGRHLKNGHLSRILPNFELKLEIPNIMLVCKFEINWSTNKNLRALTTYLGRTDARHFHIPRSALRGRGTIKYDFFSFPPYINYLHPVLNILYIHTVKTR